MNDLDLLNAYKADLPLPLNPHRPETLVSKARRRTAVVGAVAAITMLAAGVTFVSTRTASPRDSIAATSEQRKQTLIALLSKPAAAASLTAHITMTVRLGAGAGSEVSGDVDGRTGRIHLTAGGAEAVVTPNETFARRAGSTQWLRAEGSPARELIKQYRPPQPDDVIAYLRGNGLTIKDGPVVEGERTYVASGSGLGVAADRLPPEFRKHAAQSTVVYTLRAKDGLPLRVETRIPVTATMTMDLVMALTRIGEPVQISAPLARLVSAAPAGMTPTALLASVFGATRSSAP